MSARPILPQLPALILDIITLLPRFSINSSKINLSKIIVVINTILYKLMYAKNY